jgi:hypothetical protein
MLKIALDGAVARVHVVTRRRNGVLRRPRIIWIVRDGERVFIRSTNGRTADWLRGAIGTAPVRSSPVAERTR